MLRSVADRHYSLHHVQYTSTCLCVCASWAYVCDYEAYALSAVDALADWVDTSTGVVRWYMVAVLHATGLNGERAANAGMHASMQRSRNRSRLSRQRFAAVRDCYASTRAFLLFWSETCHDCQWKQQLARNRIIVDEYSGKLFCTTIIKVT